MEGWEGEKVAECEGEGYECEGRKEGKKEIKFGTCM